MNTLFLATASQRYQLAPALQLRQYGTRWQLRLNSGMTVELNPGAAAILDLCDGEHSTAEIAVLLFPRGEVTPQLARDIQDFIAAAAAQAWLLPA